MRSSDGAARLVLLLVLPLLACGRTAPARTDLYVQEGQRTVPIARDEIGRRLADGRLTPASLVAEDGRWRPLREMSGFDEIARSVPFSWPPKPGEPYPDLLLKDHAGRWVRLSSFKGKVLLIEPVGMNCAACIAFSGGNRAGAFRGNPPEAGVWAIEDFLFHRGGGLRIDDPDLVYIQLLLYSPSMKPPTAEEAEAWVKHFNLSRFPNYVALLGDDRLINQASYDMIPGLQLVDRDLVLRVDFTGHNPRHSPLQIVEQLKQWLGS